MPATTRAGLRAAKANGKALGRPKRVFRRDDAVRLRRQGVSWRKIPQVLDLPMSTEIRACRSGLFWDPTNPTKLALP